MFEKLPCKFTMTAQLRAVALVAAGVRGSSLMNALAPYGSENQRAPLGLTDMLQEYELTAEGMRAIRATGARADAFLLAIDRGLVELSGEDVDEDVEEIHMTELPGEDVDEGVEEIHMTELPDED